MRCVFYLLVVLCLQSTFGFYPVTVYNHMLRKEIFSSFPNQDWLSCTMTCARTDKCISYNYKKRPSDGRRGSFGGICELSESGFPTSNSKERRYDFIFANDWAFHQTRQYKEIASIPEFENKTTVSEDGLELSTILAISLSYLKTTRRFLSGCERIDANRWTPCWRSNVDGWDARVYHSRCDNKGSMLTLIQVQSFVFGAFVEKPCNGLDDYIGKTNSFLFSLKNRYGLSPFKMAKKQGVVAAVCKMSYGPTFGYNNGVYDVHITEKPLTRASNTDPGNSYQLPAGYTAQSARSRSLLTGSSYHFYPSSIEVFWKNCSYSF